MKNIIYPVLVACAILSVLFAGCTYPTPTNPPTIANLVYQPDRTPMNPGGTITLTGSINFFKKSGEITSVNVVTYDAKGKQIAASSIPVSGTADQTEGTLAVAVDFGTSDKGDYTFEIFVTDDKGGQSNKLTGTFEVTDLF